MLMVVGSDGGHRLWPVAHVLPRAVELIEAPIDPKHLSFTYITCSRR